MKPGARAADVAQAENDVFRKYGLGEYTTSQWTRVRGHGMGLFADSKPHILEDVDTVLVPGMALIVHPNTYHPEVGYIVLGDAVVVTESGVEVLCTTPRELFEVAARARRSEKMRRGLIARSHVELPDAVFDARLDRVRAAMREAKLDALVVYTNNTRPAGVSWLAGFVPYWSEAVLVVPRRRRRIWWRR